jgi:DNA polymerase I
VFLALTGPTGDTGEWSGRLLDDGGAPAGPVELFDARRLRAMAADLRWLLDGVAEHYPALRADGLRIERCWDVRLTERILLGRAGVFGAPVSAAAVHARATGATVPDDTAVAGPPALFGDPVPVAAADALGALATALADQQGRIGTDNALKLLVAAESASALAAVEMGAAGLPLRADVHDRLLTEALGPRPTPGARPSRMAELVDRISAAFGHPVNPDSPVELKEAFRIDGFDLESTRSSVLRRVEHPVVPDLLAYKELARLFAANGWSWLAEWVRDDRFHAEYLPGGVVSGRWAARGGGGLQIPKLVRQAVVAEPGRVFVVADAAQLEPRVLAAISGDTTLQALSADEDLYAALAADGFGGNRASAKVAMLGAMYGATTGESGRLLPILRRRYPAAMGCVEDAARRGERGESVRSVLGRASPPPGEGWWATVQAGAMPDASSRQQAQAQQTARSWGRFTRNFVVQASAADWASVWLSGLRRELAAVAGAELVLFQHDELIVHCPTENADRIGDLVVAAADEARRLVFPGSRVATPVRPVVVQRYSDAK